MKPRKKAKKPANGETPEDKMPADKPKEDK